MAGIDVFNNDAFNTFELTQAINKVPHNPGRLGQLGLFTPKFHRTRLVAVEQKEGTLQLIPTSPIGAPLTPEQRDNRNIRDFRAVRIAKGDRITAESLQGIRAFGSETELKQVMREVADRYSGETGLVAEYDLTIEHMRLGAVQGIVVDADGSTVLYNWFTEFGITAPTPINFDLDNATPASGALRKLCNDVTRAMKRASKGAWIEGRSMPYAICGDDFWDDLVTHPEVRETYLSQQEAGDLRNTVGVPFETFRFGNIMWENYRGTDDNSTVAVGTDDAKFFPAATPGVFQMAFTPAEFGPFINQPGRTNYGMILPDPSGREAFTDIELYSYPLPLCTRPEMLQSGIRT